LGATLYLRKVVINPEIRLAHAGKVKIWSKMAIRAIRAKLKQIIFSNILIISIQMWKKKK
jgi:hypothetical protein